MDPAGGPTRTIGVMSGSSLDGIDLACCRLEETPARWTFTLEGSRTVPYTPELRDRLLHATRATALELARLHRDVGRAIGDAVADLLPSHPAELVSSHGHTIFHQPAEGLTVQIGCGATIAARSGLPTVCDLRTKDVALGGQGAPLVPLGERLLFPEHQAFLNLGGISNISVHGTRTIGYDVGACNQVLDHLAAEAGQAYDQDSRIARAGQVHPALLQQLDALPFHAQAPPRSLGREWFETQVRPLIDDRHIPLADRMRTAVEHIARMIVQELDRNGAKQVLVTGGGAHNTLLVERLRAMTTVRIDVPAKELVDQKEALVFALLGLLRWRGRSTALASVTGAERDSIGGAVYLPN
ncbi:MAG TPA: anhydro-N-acetylmuramic acid kinase [Flavobacteriales bacterium]